MKDLIGPRFTWLALAPLVASELLWQYCSYFWHWRQQSPLPHPENSGWAGDGAPRIPKGLSAHTANPLQKIAPPTHRKSNGGEEK